MKHYDRSKQKIQTILIVNDDRTKLSDNSTVLTSFKIIYFSITEALSILPWVQQHQPDLIILDLEWSKVLELQLIASLRLDWLTRSIPILMITNLPPVPSAASLDYNACLIKPYSLFELEQNICSLLSLPVYNRKKA